MDNNEEDIRIRVEKEKLLAEWYDLQARLKDIKEREMSLRKELFAYYFPDPKLGKNRTYLGNSFVLEADYKLDTKMDFDAFRTICDSKNAEKLGLYFEDVVDFKPEFKEPKYKQLTAAQKELVMPALVIKPSAPAMKIIQKKTK